MVVIFGGHHLVVIFPKYCCPPAGVLNDDHGRSLPKGINPWSSMMKV